MRDDLIRKVKALADKGVGGEKINAEALLKKLMLKYGLTEDDIMSEKLIQFRISTPKKGHLQSLFIQILHACGYDENGSFHLVGGNSKEWIFEAPISTKIDFLERWEFYRAHYLEDLDTFFLAFLYKNKLLCDSGKDDSKPDQKTINKHLKAQKMLFGLDQHVLNKAIEYRG